MNNSEGPRVIISEKFKEAHKNFLTEVQYSSPKTFDCLNELRKKHGLPLLELNDELVDMLLAKHSTEVPDPQPIKVASPSLPSLEVCRQVAARIWTDKDYSHVVMDTGKCERIARILAGEVYPDEPQKKSVYDETLGGGSITPPRDWISHYTIPAPIQVALKIWENNTYYSKSLSEAAEKLILEYLSHNWKEVGSVVR